MEDIREVMVARFEETISDVRYIREKFFFEQNPEAKERYNQFKKDVKTYKYASDEHVYTYTDKSGKIVSLERDDILLTPLLKEHLWLAKIVGEAVYEWDKRQQEEKARQNLEKRREPYDKKLEDGEIDLAFYKAMEHYGFRPMAESVAMRRAGY